MAKELGFNLISLSNMWNWETWPMEEFQRLNVTDTQHPQYHELLDIIAPFRTDKQIIGLAKL